MAGGIAWLAWLGVHLLVWIGFQNRVLVLIRSLFSFATRSHGARLITDRQPKWRRAETLALTR